MKVRFSFDWSITSDEGLRLLNRVLISVIVMVAGTDFLSLIQAI